jgi:hypothetical protein
MTWFYLSIYRFCDGFRSCLSSLPDWVVGDEPPKIDYTFFCIGVQHFVLTTYCTESPNNTKPAPVRVRVKAAIYDYP